MALVELLRPGEFIPQGTYSNTVAGVFKIVPAPGSAWRMFPPQSAGNTIFRGRLVNKNAAFTSIVAQIGTWDAATEEPVFGAANGGLEATVLTLSATSVTNANTWMMPAVRLLLNGTAGVNDTDCRLVMGFGFPVAAVTCVAALVGMPWTVGDNLLNNSDRVVVA
jgi:hypothetical protein